ncbi:MAG: histidine kinase [Clostridia bacterium]|nr:histidine kinase [Clostridia bacterium]
MKKSRKWKGLQHIAIQTKLIFLFIFTSLFIFGVNLYVYVNLNQMIGKIDGIYASNVSLNDMADTLNNVQTSLTEYLKTKSTDSLELYYKSFQTYTTQLSELNVITTNNDMKLMEKSIRNMSDTYLKITNETLQAKRGRNVDKYISGHEKAEQLFSYISTYIYSLNNEQFKSNSTNYETLLASLKYSEILCMSILVVVAMANTLLIILVTRSITNPLKDLSKRADEIAQGHLDGELLEIKSEDEVGVVTKAFNQMLLSIREYIEQIRQRIEMESAMKEKELMMSAHLKDAQLKYLQAQINPHFLFNTLNAGAQLAMMEGADKTNRYVQNMADFFRYNVKKNNENVSIAEEIELVDSYIYILNVRFSGEIHFQKNIDDTLLSYHIPSMILQPIVENSVNYGIRNIEWEGLIVLSLYKDQDMICISIKDNGIGIQEDRIKQIMAQEIEPSDLSKDSNGIGLTNVISRLKLFFGREDVFFINSEGENKGTEVIIRIPAE